jgi:hypothetical protein
LIVGRRGAIDSRKPPVPETGGWGIIPFSSILSTSISVNSSTGNPKGPTSRRLDQIRRLEIDQKDETVERIDFRLDLMSDCMALAPRSPVDCPTNCQFQATSPLRAGLMGGQFEDSCIILISEDPQGGMHACTVPLPCIGLAAKQKWSANHRVIRCRRISPHMCMELGLHIENRQTLGV